MAIAPKIREIIDVWQNNINLYPAQRDQINDSDKARNVAGAAIYL